MKALPISKQFFDELIRNNCVYVDKTALIYKLITKGESTIFQFFSRPRRFGKSLLVSTIYHLFRGEKKLFQGLWIEDKLNWEEHVYPVIRIDFNSISYNQADINLALMDYLDDIAYSYDLAIEALDAGDKFQKLITSLHEKTGKQVVLLIDEYDKPLIDFIGREDKAEKLQYHTDVLKSFYSTLKSLASTHLKYTLITGVAKIGKLSLFSDLNHLDDLTLDKEYATLFGFTEEELDTHFGEYLQAFAQTNRISLEQTKEVLKEWYDGYSFDGETRVYAPFSLIKAFARKVIANFWFETGTPTFLIELLKKDRFAPIQIEGTRSDYSLMESSEINTLSSISLLFQTGYLTIHSVTKKMAIPTYTLGYPNREVRESMQRHLLAAYTSQSSGNLKALLLDQIEASLAEKDMEGVIESMKIVFSQVPYQ